jgi:hypothetical protein
MIFKLVLILQTSFQASIAFVRDTSTCNQTVNSNPIYVLTTFLLQTRIALMIYGLLKILFPQATITIFNRYGKLLKESNKYGLEWHL